MVSRLTYLTLYKDRRVGVILLLSLFYLLIALNETLNKASHDFYIFLLPVF